MAAAKIAAVFDVVAWAIALLVLRYVPVAAGGTRRSVVTAPRSSAPAPAD
jgi:hypothetical protein